MIIPMREVIDKVKYETDEDTDEGDDDGSEEEYKDNIYEEKPSTDRQNCEEEKRKEEDKSEVFEEDLKKREIIDDDLTSIGHFLIFTVSKLRP